jgi:hypothetical protein
VTARLKLIALDADDLAVISAHVQDAGVRTSGIIRRQGARTITGPAISAGAPGRSGWMRKLRPVTPSAKPSKG